MEASSAKDVQFIGGTKGGFIFPEFLFASDGMYSVAKILEMMAMTGKRFGVIDKEVPHLHLQKRSIHCPWERKGRVMRYMMQETEGMHRVLVDGIKIFVDSDSPTTSVLMWPDKAKPLFHIQAESNQRKIVRAPQSIRGEDIELARLERHMSSSFLDIDERRQSLRRCCSASHFLFTFQPQNRILAVTFYGLGDRSEHEN